MLKEPRAVISFVYQSWGEPAASPHCSHVSDSDSSREIHPRTDDVNSVWPS